MSKRSRGKRGITLDGIYQRYRKKYRGNPIFDVDRSTFGIIIREFNNTLADALINEAFEFKMPFHLGRIRIKKYKQRIKLDKNGEIDKRDMPVNWKKTWELWGKIYPGLTKKELKEIPGKQLVYHLNEHTSGYRCMLFWDKRSCVVKNSRAYSIKFTWANRRKLAHLLKTNCKINYYE